jgi:hypothetical protein
VTCFGSAVEDCLCAASGPGAERITSFNAGVVLVDIGRSSLKVAALADGVNIPVRRSVLVFWDVTLGEDCSGCWSSADLARAVEARITHPGQARPLQVTGLGHGVEDSLSAGELGPSSAGVATSIDTGIIVQHFIRRA